MILFFKNLLTKIGIDASIGYTIFTRIVQAAGAIGVIIIIAKYLSKDEQGYYYTFSSIIAIQVFFELGLSGIITQYAAHEFAHLKLNEDNELEGDDYYASRLSSILHLCVKWFGSVSVFLFFLLILTGFYFFSKFNKSNYYTGWEIPWIILSLATSLNLFIDPILALFEGIGKIKEISKIRLIQKTINVLLLYLLLICNFKLYSSAVASFVAVVSVYITLSFSSNFKTLKLIWCRKTNWVISYMGEIFPYQWRIALSWISGYFIFQLFNPVLFATRGPVVAGQMGMTLQAINGIITISMSWITTKVPIFSSLVSQKLYAKLDQLFNTTLKNLIFVTSFLVIIFVVGIFIMGYFNLSIRLRFLPTLPLICLSITAILNQFVFSWATYLRCHKKEPFLIISIAGGIYCTISTIVFGNLFGLNGMVFGYTLWSFVGLILAYYIFKIKSNEWHKL